MVHTKYFIISGIPDIILKKDPLSIRREIKGEKNSSMCPGNVFYYAKDKARESFGTFFCWSLSLHL